MKNFIANMTQFLNYSQDIITTARETEFSELKKRDRKAIVAKFRELLTCIEDGDSDYSTLSLGKKAIYGVISDDLYDNLYIVFFSSSFDIDDDPDTGYFDVDQTSNSLEGIEATRKILTTLSPLPIAVLNIPLMTTDGLFRRETISLDQARDIVSGNTIVSAIGHQATAEVLTELLGTEVPMNRINFLQEKGQRAIVLKMNGRLPEGVILSREEMDKIGYTFQLATRIE